MPRLTTQQRINMQNDLGAAIKLLAQYQVLIDNVSIQTSECVIHIWHKEDFDRLIIDQSKHTVKEDMWCVEHRYEIKPGIFVAYTFVKPKEQ